MAACQSNAPSAFSPCSLRASTHARYYRALSHPPALLVAATVWFSSCSSDVTQMESSSLSDAGGPRNAASDGAMLESVNANERVDGGIMPPMAPGSEFAAVYETVFKMYCVGCHGGGTAGLNMSSATAAYQALVGVPANPNGMCGKTGLKRVEPGDPSKSLLFLKLQTAAAPCGQQMPVGGELKPELKTLIEQWIAAGAH
jgi:hypothetical protein